VRIEGFGITNSDAFTGWEETQGVLIGSDHVDCFQTFDNNGESLRDVLVEGNTCMDFHQGFMGEASFHQASSNITFRNNVFAHGGAWGLSVHRRSLTSLGPRQEVQLTG